MPKNTVIFDLDGTLAIIDNRKKLSTNSNGKMNWDSFFDPKNISLDEPNFPVIKLAQLFTNDGFKIVILSGRSNSTNEATRTWLKKYKVPYVKLIMRPDTNDSPKNLKFMSDDKLKKYMLETYLDINDIYLVVDDRSKVVKMWRELGLKTFQVAEGDF